MDKRRAIAVTVLCLAGFAGAAKAQTASTTSTLTATTSSAPEIAYQKVFKGSTPSFTEIMIHRDGNGTFDIRQLDEQPNPQPFTVGAALTGEIFQLAGQLHDFEGVQLEVPRKIAYLGEKTFRYEAGSTKHEVTFNYTLNADASQLQRIFEGLGRQQTDIQDLQRTMRYDRLGVNDVLERIQDDMNANALPEPQSLLPVLDQISSDERFMEIARQRARTLADRIRNPHS